MLNPNSAPVAAFQRRTVASSAPETAVAPSRGSAALNTGRRWPSSVATRAASAVRHTRSVASPDPDSAVAPSRERATLRTGGLISQLDSLFEKFCHL